MGHILALLCLPFIALMNFLSQRGYFGPSTIPNVAYAPGEILTPATRAFAIRGLIYLGILAYLLYQAFSKRKDEATIKKITPWVIANLVANGLWYYVSTFPGKIRMSAVVIVFMRVSLGFINKYLSKFDKNRIDRLCVTIPMSIYFGRITVATPLNIAAAFKDLGYTRAVTNPMAVLFWVGLARVTSVVVFLKTKRMSYNAVIVRALIAVMQARYADSTFLFVTAVVLACGTLGLSIRAIMKRNRTV